MNNQIRDNTKLYKFIVIYNKEENKQSEERHFFMNIDREYAQMMFKHYKANPKVHLISMALVPTGE